MVLAGNCLGVDCPKGSCVSGSCLGTMSWGYCRVGSYLGTMCTPSVSHCAIFHCRKVYVSLQVVGIFQVVWDKETLFTGAEDTEIDYEVCSLEGGSRPEPVLENIYRRVILRVSVIKTLYFL